MSRYEKKWRAPGLVVAGLALVLASGCASPSESPEDAPAAETETGAETANPGSEPALGAYARVDSVLAAEPLAAGDSIRVTGLGSGIHSTVVLIQLAPGAVVPGHVHRDHDEAVHVVRGRCTMVLGERRLSLEPGGVVLAPALTPHGAKAGPEGCAVVSTYAPLWNPEDRYPDPRGDP